MNHIMKKIISALIAFGILFGAPAIAFASATTLRVVQTPTIHLYSGMSSTATSARIAPYPKDLDGNKLTITDFGSVPTFTVDPKVTGVEEILSFTGITDNGDNTATLTGLTHDLASKYPYTTSGIGRTHGANSILVFSNNPQLYGRLAGKENDETITGAWIFPTFDPSRAGIASDIDTAVNTAFVTFGQLSRQAVAGAANASETAKGLVQLGTALQVASSSSSGSTAARLVIPSSMATDTPQIGCAVGYTATAGAGCSVVAQLTGKIRQTFLDIFTTINTWAGNQIFNANVTIAASNISTANLTLNALAYKWPSTRAASSTVLSEDGSGNLTFEPGHQIYSAAFIAGSTATNAYATTSLMSLPAGLMTASSTIETSGNFSCIGTSGTACDVYLRDGTGATFATFQVASAAGANGSSPKGTFSFKVLPTFTASAQTTIIQTSIVGLDFTGGGSTAVISGLNTGGSGTSAIALASAFTLNIVIRSEGAAAQASMNNVSAIVRQ